MKATFKIMALSFLCVLFMGACGKKEKTIAVTGQNGVVYESYQEACTAQDFVAAHQFLDRMKAEASMMPNGSEKQKQKKHDAEANVEVAKDYITNKEILLLTSLDDETAFDRIVFLLKENEFSDFSNDKYCDKVIDLAIDLDKDKLVKKITNIYRRPISDNMLRKIINYLYLNKGDENLGFVTSLLNRYDKNGLLLDAAVEKGNEALIVDMAQRFDGKMSFNTFKNVMDWLGAHNNVQYGSLFRLLSTKTEDKEKLFDYAIKKGDEESIVYLAQQFDGALSFNKIINILDFLDTHNSKKYNYVFKLLSTKVLDDEKMINYAIEKKQKNIAKDLLKNYGGLINNNALISNLASLNDKGFSDMILFALAEKGKNLPSRPSINGYVKSDSYGKLDGTEHGMYNKKIKEYNAQCKSVMNIAIASKNLYLAKSVIPKMKQVFVYTDLGDWVKVVEKRNDHSSLYEAFKLSLSNEDIDDAKQTLNDAIKSGSFK